jgi:indolepyruvate ferredoxin oxidoreductase, beta subunit
METKIILCGLGGQGVVFLTRLLAKTAIANGYPVMVSETHGMSQRGGSVISHLKISGNQAPLIPHGTADILIALEADEAVRNLPYLRSGGTAFVNATNGLRLEVASEVSRLGLEVHCVPASQLAIDLRAAAVANVVLAGFVAAHSNMLFSFASLQETLKSASKRGLDLNLIALETGYNAKKEQINKDSASG